MTRKFTQPTAVVKKYDEPLRWFTLDAEGKTLGRLASEIVKILRGKHKTSFTPNLDTGDGVVVINCEKVHVSGNKEAQKSYFHHSRFMGGLKEIPYRTMLDRHPDRIIERAVKGMMPKTKLAQAQRKKLRIFKGDKHSLEAQQPINVEV
jgi:large subunit ribosomal protein L13